MAYLCETLTVIDSVQYGMNCMDSSIFQLTPEARDELLKFVIKVFALVFVANKVLSIFR